MPKKVFRMQLLGGKELAEALGELPRSVAKATLQKACMDALKPTLEAAKDLAGSVVHPQSGRFEKSFIISLKLKPGQAADDRHAVANGEAQKYFVTVHVGSTDRKAHLLEFGHLARDGSHVRAFPVMRPAWDSTNTEVLHLLGAALWAQLAASARKLNIKSQKNTLSTSQQKVILGY